MFIAIVIAAVILIAALVVLLTKLADKRRMANHHIGLPELGSLTKAAEDSEVEVRRAKAEHSQSSREEHGSQA